MKHDATLTGSNFDIPAGDGAYTVGGNAGVERRMNVLSEVLGSELWKYERPIGSHVTESGHFGRRDAVGKLDPPNSGRRLSRRLAGDARLLGVGELHQTRRLVLKPRTLLVGVHE